MPRQAGPAPRLHFSAVTTLTLGLACALVATGSAECRAQEVGGFRAEDLHQLRSVGSVQISPDGQRVAYTVQSREGAGGPGSELWIRDLSAEQPRSLGAGGGPRWSPDGSWIAFDGRTEEGSGIVVVRPDGSGRRLVAETRGTNHPTPSTGEDVTWSPDGRRIAFVSATEGPEGAQARADADPIVIRRYLYKTTGADGRSYFDDNRRLHLFVVDLASGDVRQLTDGTGYEHSIDWSPDGREILFLSNTEPDPDRFFNYDIRAVDVASGEVRPITRRESVVYRPRWSPDGGSIVFQGTRRGLTSSETTMEDTRIWRVEADGTNARVLAPAVDNRQGAPAWSPDGRWVYFTVQTRGEVHLLRVPAQGGTAEAVVADRGRVASWSLAPGGAVAYAFTGPEDEAQLYVGGGSQAPRRVTDLNRQLLSRRTVAPVEAMTFVSFDGVEVEAFLTHPLGEEGNAKHPLVVMIHGGPHGQQGPEFDHKAQVYAAQGWATLKVNYRGSTGYGQSFVDLIFADQNGAEAMDVLQGVDAATRRFAWIDPDRVGIEGGSYGGQLTNWLITQTRRFAAAIPRAGISNLVSFNYLSYYHDYLAVEYGGFPHQADIMDQLWERSPIRYVARVATPTLLVHGLNDHNVPTSEAEQFYIA
ncbi:MAG TPA: S9 family peptidase, partial [Longimicrobiales bacterium]|nr:S9 family peptidase [Longimicrobiales bacterium]